MDKRYENMLVMEIADKVYQKIKNDKTSVEAYFSYLLSSHISTDLLNNTFFSAKFLDWSAFEQHPYAKLLEECGSIYDIDNQKSVIL